MSRFQRPSFNLLWRGGDLKVIDEDQNLNKFLIHKETKLSVEQPWLNQVCWIRMEILSYKTIARRFKYCVHPQSQ